MKKIFTVIAISAAALLAVSCSNPSSAIGGSGNSGSDPAGPTDIPDVSINNQYTAYATAGRSSEIYFRLNNVSDTDEIELIIVDNPNNITLNNLRTVWKKDDTEGWLTKYGSHYTERLGGEPNIYFAFTPDKAGKISYYVKDKTTNWYIDPKNWTWKLEINEPSSN